VRSASQEEEAEDKKVGVVVRIIVFRGVTWAPLCSTASTCGERVSVRARGPADPSPNL
jgi:hypothetical protein